MKTIFALIAAFLIVTGCKRNTPPEPTATTDTTVVTDTMASETEVTNANGDYETYYVVVADTAQDYYTLHGQMLQLHVSLPATIDTMGRYYNKAKNKIVLPDDDEDDIYAGDYYPRRYPGSTLSLEYLSMYKDNTDTTTIALVTGIFETKKSADSANAILQKYSKNSFVLKSEIYVGCMH